MFVEINSRNFFEEPVEFHNLQFKNNVKIHPTSKCFYFSKILFINYNLVYKLFKLTESSESYLMIQWGSGLFEYTLDNKVIFSGKIAFLNKNDIQLCTESNKIASLDTRSDDFHASISKDEIYNIIENKGFDLGDNFKNITNLDIYKNNVQGYVKWKNDWIYFIDGLLKFPSLDNLDAYHTQAPFSVRKMSIAPMMFKSNTEEGINKYS